MIKKQKAQITLEILVAIIVLMIFIFVFRQLVTITQETIETNHIKTEQIKLANSLNDLFTVTQGFVGDGGFYAKSNITDFSFNYEIPRIIVGTRKLNCQIDVNQTNIVVKNHHNKYIETNLSGLFLENIDDTFYCGQTIECFLDNNEIECT